MLVTFHSYLSKLRPKSTFTSLHSATFLLVVVFFPPSHFIIHSFWSFSIFDSPSSITFPMFTHEEDMPTPVSTTQINLLNLYRDGFDAGCIQIHYICAVKSITAMYMAVFK